MLTYVFFMNCTPLVGLQTLERHDEPRYSIPLELLFLVLCAQIFAHVLQIQYSSKPSMDTCRCSQYITSLLVFVDMIAKDQIPFNEDIVEHINQENCSTKRTPFGEMPTRNTLPRFCPQTRPLANKQLKNDASPGKPEKTVDLNNKTWLDKADTGKVVTLRACDSKICTNHT